MYQYSINIATIGRDIKEKSALSYVQVARIGKLEASVNDEQQRETCDYQH
jgi:hypothetical protein